MSYQGDKANVTALVLYAQSLEERNAKLVAALTEIERTIAGWERIMCLPNVKELTELWNIASEAIQQSTEKP